MTMEETSVMHAPAHAKDQEEDAWIPLSTNESVEGNATTGTSMPSSHTRRHSEESSTQRLHGMRRRLETRVSLKTNLVDHPIDMFWRRFLWNLAREVWALEIHIRLGLSLIISGICLKLFILSTWYFWYPRFALSTVIFLVSMLYLDPFDVKSQMDGIGRIFCSLDKAAEALKRLDTIQLRRLSFFLLMIPTALEMRTLSFLSQIKAESGWIMYNFVLAASILSLMMHLFKVKNMKPRECLYQGLLALYGSALLVTVIKTDIGRMPVLAAPFFTATGTLLITYNDDDMEWMSRVLRHALRLTLRDVLSSVGERVTEDDMLKLAILRWIADYWASTSDANSSQPAQASTDSTQRPRPTPRPQSSSSTQDTQPTDMPQAQTPSRPNDHSQTPQSHFPQQEVQWGDLLPMLNVANDHMQSEVRLLQPDSNEQSQSTSNSLGEGPSNAHTSNANGTPFDDLRNMLASLNADEKAELAVRAYRRSVESFPPDKKTAVLVSVCRRCPALLTLCWHLVFGSKSFFISTMLLLPFVAVEYFRIEAWICACEQMKTSLGETTEERDAWWGTPPALADADPMIILLCGDTYNPARPPTLLLVWGNVVGSISALEVGLTGARVVSTTAVTVQFAGNVMSLLQLGHEVQRHGLLHGLAVVAKEVITMHASGSEPHNPDATKYASAAMGAMENAQKVARNVQTLREDDNLGHVIRPVVWTLCTLSGYGWIWGNDDDRPDVARDDAATPDSNETAAAADDEQASAAYQHARNSENVEVASAMVAQSDDENSICDDRPESDTASGAKAGEGPNDISDVMDMIALTYERSLIDEAEKDHFCEKLSKLLSSSDELSNSAIVERMRRTLQTVLDSGSAQNETNWQVTEDIDRVNPSSLMELTLTAYFKGLIDESEKKAFCERIAGLSDVERSDPAVVGGMLRTLQAIVGEEAKPNDSENLKIATSRQSEEEENAPESERSEKSEQNRLEDPSEWRPLASQANPHGEHVDVASRLNIPSVGNGVVADQVPGNTGLERDNLTPPTTLNDHVVNTNCNEESKEAGGARVENNSERTGDEIDGWVKFGMATLGVVVGGVLLSMQGGNETESAQNQEENRRRNVSTVVIEELQDENEDEWISVQNAQ